MPYTEIENQIARTIVDAYIYLDGIDQDQCSLVIESYIHVRYEPPDFDIERTSFQIPGGFTACIYYDDTFASIMTTDFAVDTMQRVASFVGVGLLGACGVRDAYGTLLKPTFRTLTVIKGFLLNIFSTMRVNKYFTCSYSYIIYLP
jgi:hypothetical protein